MTKQESMAIEIVAKHTGLSAQHIVPATSLEEMQVDSLKFIVILLEIQAALGRDILTVENVGNIKTVEDLLALVSQAQRAAPE